MAKREALRELQSRLAERLQAALTEVPSTSWLAVHCAGLGLIFPDGETAIPIILRYIRYALVGVWVSGLAPLLFIKLRLSAPKR